MTTLSDGGAGEGWRPPKLAVVGEPVTPAETAADTRIEDAMREGREAGYDAGFAAGQAEGRKQADALARQLEALLDALAAPFAESDAALLRETLALTQRVAAAVLRRELRADPGLIENVLQDALAVLGDVRGDIELTLHPADARLCRDLDVRLAPSTQVRESPAISRGGLTVHAGSELIDATVEARLNAVIGALYENAGLPEPPAAKLPEDRESAVDRPAAGSGVDAGAAAPSDHDR